VAADGGVAHGAAVEAMLRSMQGVFPDRIAHRDGPWAAIFGFAAVKLFTCEQAGSVRVYVHVR